MRLREFLKECQRIRAVAEFVREPVLLIEIYSRKDGTDFLINHLHQVIYVRFPGREDWFDYEFIDKWKSLGIMQSELTPTLPDEKVMELNRLLRLGKGGAG
jgi:hypothetical protein